MNRGILTDEIVALAQKNGFEEFNTMHLRILPYLQYCCVNHQKINPSSISSEERKVISEWRKNGLIDGGASEPISMSQRMWDFTCSLMWISYALQLNDYNSEEQL